jgi:hypothetical protein
MQPNSLSKKNIFSLSVFAIAILASFYAVWSLGKASNLRSAFHDGRFVFVQCECVEAVNQDMCVRDKGFDAIVEAMGEKPTVDTQVWSCYDTFCEEKCGLGHSRPFVVINNRKFVLSAGGICSNEDCTETH